MKRPLLTLAAAVIALAAADPARAADVASAGASLDNASPVDLTSSALGTNVQGTLFWDYEGATVDHDRDPAAVNDFQRNNLPAYMTFGPGADLQGVSGGWGYAQVIDDAGGPFETGTLATLGGGADAELATFTIGAGAPAKIRLGVMLDNLDGSAFVGSNLTVEAVGGTSASVDPSADANQLSDIYWFDITNLTDGNVLSIQSGASSNDFSTIAGFVIIPEPLSMALLGFACAGGALLRRRRI